MWKQRTIEQFFNPKIKPLSHFPIWLVLGPRQVGKSSLLIHKAAPNRGYINLDDIGIRTRATADPELFSKELNPPLCIDEIQYAPQLLSTLKIFADKKSGSGSIWLTGSQNFQVMQGVRETLAGRVAIINLLGFSDEEKGVKKGTPQDYFYNIIETSFPTLLGEVDPKTRALYLSSYISTYIERDIRELLGVEKRREFEIFVKLCALRSGQEVNYDSLAQDAGISPVTAKNWLGVLEDSFLIKIVHPYASNRSKRLIKRPKLYFLDMGLAAHIASWHDSELLRNGPQGGAAFETHVLGQILRFMKHRLLPGEVYYWRTRDQDEIDFLVEIFGKVYPIEVKLGTAKGADLLTLDKIKEDNWQAGNLISLTALAGAESHKINADWQLRSPLDFTFLEGN